MRPGTTMVRHQKAACREPGRRGTAPQGGIVASANDLARYLQTMMKVATMC